MSAYPYLPGVPAAGHVSGGFWHPGQIGGCPKCPDPPRPTRKRDAGMDTNGYDSLTPQQHLPRPWTGEAEEIPEIPEYVKAGTPEVAYGVWEPGHGTRIDGSVVYWRARKADAAADAKSIGWPVNSVWPVHTRFQDGYAISQRAGGYLTRKAFAALASNRNGETSA